MQAVLTQVDPLIRKADRMAFSETTNQAENFMRFMCKFLGGKRVNFSKRGSFTTRGLGAGLGFQGGPSWSGSPWKRKTGYSPGKYFKKLLRRRRKQRAHCTKSLFGKESTGRNQRKAGQKRAGTDSDYGPHSDKPDMSTELF